MGERDGRVNTIIVFPMLSQVGAPVLYGSVPQSLG